MYIAGIERSLPKAVVFSSFADDFRINFSHASVGRLAEVLENSLLLLANNLESRGLAISFLKTKFLIITTGKKQIRERSIHIRVHKHVISNDRTAKYLGISHTSLHQSQEAA